MLIVDECQNLPELFPALKEHVRLNPKKGQILLTGSVRFSSREAIRESLTGRYIATELLPFDECEIASNPLSSEVVRCLEAKDLTFFTKKSEALSEAKWKNFLIRGRLPAFFSRRDASINRQAFDTQIEALLNRDLRLIFETLLSIDSLLNFCRELSLLQGTSIEYEDLRRRTRISVPVIKKLLSALEATFVIRRIPTQGGTQKDCFYFEDQGEATHLTGAKELNLKSFERYIYQSLRSQWMYRPELEATFFRWRTRNGSEVPFVLTSDNKVLGILPMLEENPSHEILGSAYSLLGHFPQAKIIFVHPGNKNEAVGNSQRIVPISSLT